jgi:nitrate reductase gamma subunit
MGGVGGEEPALAATGADVVHVGGLAALLVALGLAALVVRRATDRRS